MLQKGSEHTNQEFGTFQQITSNFSKFVCFLKFPDFTLVLWPTLKLRDNSGTFKLFRSVEALFNVLYNIVSIVSHCASRALSENSARY